ncbi:TetR/AcrR family transcriptional regulator [Promicromonospora sp. NPDC090134]|uniref:TetR/AcrR family transcriptional regulator n=1 Tax=Promicromonospora sp. NPDC090134 TaxID=3364408 RepID=UPI0038144AEE
MERDLRQDALAAARRLLEADGVRGVTMSAVACDLAVPDAELGRAGVDRVALLEALYESTMDRLLAFLGAAVAQQDPDDLAAQVEAGTHAIVVWCGTHRAEFDLLMGPGFRQAVGARAAVRQSVASRLGGAWAPLFDRVRRAGAPYPPDADIPADLAAQLDVYRRLLLRANPGMGDDLPLGVVYLMTVGWRQIFGLLCMLSFDPGARPVSAFGDSITHLNRSLLDLVGLAPSPAVRLVVVPGAA